MPDNGKELPPLTDFQKAILWAAERTPNGQASAWHIAQVAFYDTWKKPAARGALIGHIRRAANKMRDMCCVLPPKRQHDDYTICVLNKRN